MAIISGPFQPELQPHIDAVSAQAGIRSVAFVLGFHRHTPGAILTLDPDREIIIQYGEDDMVPNEELYRVILWQRQRGDHWLIAMTSYHAYDRDVPAAEIGAAILAVLDRAAVDPLPAYVSHQLTGTPWIIRACRSLLPRKATR